MSRPIDASLALTVAALFLSGCGKSAQSAEPAAPDTVAAGALVKCLGINECKGQGQCGGTGAHVCAGQNDCKGKGWLQVSQAECDEKVGQVL